MNGELDIAFVRAESECPKRDRKCICCMHGEKKHILLKCVAQYAKEARNCSLYSYTRQ
jgi:hypothetical protein